MANLKVALVGCGKIGQKHLQALVHCPTVDLIATADIDREKSAAAAVAFDAAAYGDMDALLSQHPDIDGVIIATPSGTHRALAERALQNGKHVLVEKPFALTTADAKAMVRAAERAAKILTVTQFNRLLPTVALASEAFRHQRIGRLIEGGISVLWARPQSYYDAEPWRGMRAMGGGVLFDQAVHALDVLLQFTGPIAEVFAYSATLTHDIETEDTVAAVLRAESGALLTVNVTTSVAEANLEERVTVVGDAGSIVLGPTVQQIEFWRVPGDDEDEVRQEMNQSRSRSGWQSHLASLEDFERAVTSGLPTRLSGHSALHSIEVIEALMNSAREGRPMAVGSE